MSKDVQQFSNTLLPGGAIHSRNRTIYFILWYP